MQLQCPISSPFRIATIKNKTKQKITGVGEDAEKLKPLCTVGGNVKWCSLLWKTVWWFLKILKVELSFFPEISLLGIYSKELYTLFIAALFTIAKSCRQPM